MSATRICTREFDWTSSIRGDPARLAIGDVPFGDEPREQRGPCVCTNLGADLRDAYEGDKAGRSHPARVLGWVGERHLGSVVFPADMRFP